jgi:hypothetical protein
VVDASVEALGDGRTVKTEVVVPSVFTGKTVQKSRIDLTPEKFKAAQEDTTIEESVAGTVNPSISLGAGEFRKSEQQVTEFVKRTSTTNRDIGASTDLEEIVITNQGQVATRTLILSAEAQSIQPDALLVDGSIEELGDGRTIKTEVRVTEVFEGKNLSLEKPDVTPQKFRAAIPASSVETTVAGTVTDPIVLAGNEISKSEQQVTEFVKRIRATTRDPAAEATITGAKVYTSELGGGIANVTETYSSSGEITADLNTVSVSSEALGDGKFVGQKVELPIIPTLVGQDYDEILDVVFPYTQTVVPTLLTVPETLEVGVDLAPRNNLQTVKRTRDKEASREALLAFNWTFGSTVNISLPDLLEGVTCINSISTGGGYQESEYGIPTNANWYVNIIGGSYTVIGNLVYDIKEGFSGPVDANRHVFFLDRDSATLQNVIDRLNTLSVYQGTMAGFKPSTTVSRNVKKWPKTKPKKHTIVVTGGTTEIQSQQINSKNPEIIEETEPPYTTNRVWTNKFGSVTTSENIIPPTLHEGIKIETQDVTAADISSIEDDGPSIDPINTKISVFFEEGRDLRFDLQPTEPPFFQAGNYLVSIDTEPYRFGLVRVSTVVTLITNDYL